MIVATMSLTIATVIKIIRKVLWLEKVVCSRDIQKTKSLKQHQSMMLLLNVTPNTTALGPVGG